jgi:hypothetical protein
LKGISTRISKVFDMVIKYAGEVVTHEKEAKDASKKMEEASLKAQFARKNMFNVRIISLKSRQAKKQGILQKQVLLREDLVLKHLVE